MGEILVLANNFSHSRRLRGTAAGIDDDLRREPMKVRENSVRHLEMALDDGLPSGREVGLRLSKGTDEAFSKQRRLYKQCMTLVPILDQSPPSMRQPPS